MSATTTTMTTPTTTPTTGQKGMFDQLGEHASNLGKRATNAFSGLFAKKKTDPTTTAPGFTGGRSRRRRRSRSRSRKGGNPKKGMASKSRKGRKDFVTHKGNKYYNRKGHRQSRNAKGKRKSPYRKH